MERIGPKTLKDLLSENPSSSCSSSGFKSLPRRIKPNHDPTTIVSIHTPNYTSTFQTLINTIKSIMVKKKSLPSMILPRGISRKLSSSSRRIRSQSQTFCKGGTEVKVSTVKVKDIIRWKSFGDVSAAEEHRNQPPPPLDFNRFTVGSTSTTTTTTTACSSNGSSWSDTDFSTSEYLSLWEEQNGVVGASEKFSLSPFVSVTKDLVEPTIKMVESKGISTCQEDEQHSPVSVLQVGKDEFSPFDQSLANIKRKKQKFMQIQRVGSLAKFDIANLDQYLLLDENLGYDEEFEEQDYVEERARHLLHCLKSTCSIEYYLDTLLLDFFREELIGMRRDQTRNDEDEFEWEILRMAKDWIKGSFGYDIGHVNNDACINDMDRRGGWSRFEEEKEELALEIEISILHSLVDEFLDLKC